MIYQLVFIGTTELLLIGGMALLLFGGKKLPEMMRGLGQGVKEFKKGMESPSDFTKDESREDGVEKPKADNINERETDGKE